jgi:hypothetical protein
MPIAMRRVNQPANPVASVLSGSVRNSLGGGFWQRLASALPGELLD